MQILNVNNILIGRIVSEIFTQGKNSLQHKFSVQESKIIGVPKIVLSVINEKLNPYDLRIMHFID